jgi:SAM-dependent methyltransferase
MQDLIKEYIQICSETLPISGPIYEFGSLQVPGQEGYADLRPFFPNKEYVGADMREGPGVDVVLDLHDIDLPDESVETVLALETLEHVEYVRQAVHELHRILKPNGILIISSLMKFPIHSYPYDYWRFTPEAFKSLLKPFSSSLVGYAGRDDFPQTIVGIGFKGQISEEAVAEFKEKYDRWKVYWSHPKRDKKGFFEKLWNSTKKRWNKLKGLFVK